MTAFRAALWAEALKARMAHHDRFPRGAVG